MIFYHISTCTDNKDYVYYNISVMSTASALLRRSHGKLSDMECAKVVMIYERERFSCSMINTALSCKLYMCVYIYLILMFSVR